MRFSLYVAALIVADAILRVNWNYTEVEMRWLAVAGGLFLIMDLCDWTRTTWDWLASKNWRKRDCLREIRKQYYPGPKRYELTYRGSNGNQRSGS